MAAAERKAFQEFCYEVRIDPAHVRLLFTNICQWIDDGAPDARQVEMQNLFTFRSRDYKRRYYQFLDKMVVTEAGRDVVTKGRKRTRESLQTFGEEGTEILLNYSEGTPQEFRWTLMPTQEWVLTFLKQNGTVYDLVDATIDDFKIGWDNATDIRIRHRITTTAAQTRTALVFLRPARQGRWIASRGSAFSNLGLCRISEVTLWDHDSQALVTTTEDDESTIGGPSELNHLEEAEGLFFWHLLRPYSTPTAFPWRTGSKT